MHHTDRRNFLKLMGSGALATALPASIERALAIPANNRTKSITDVEHIVILMQENRSFDHYFGAMRGVRGFADPRAVKLPNGQPVWYQPDGNGYLLPFRPDVADVGGMFLPDPPHGWNDSHEAWNGGKFDRWVPAKGVSAMTYHTRSDIAYHYALADAFTICDAYFCSLMGPTDPNRYHMWTGWCGNDGKGGGPVITNAEAGYDWSTYPERLQQAGITWKIYQDIGVGLNADGFWGWTGDPYIGNYGDNSLLYFHQFQNAQPGTPLADLAKTGTNINALNREPARLLDIFRADVASGKLPQVSWIVSPEAYSEHPNHPADYGAWYVSQVLDALTANPDVWSKTALFVTFDEAGGFFDHVVPPTPPQSDLQGGSTLSTANEIFPGDGDGHVSGPYGFCSRVPTVVVSPWSKGGYVNSQVFDHTSLIRFIEARFAKHHSPLVEANITRWRRAVAGDLTSTFNFISPNETVPALPNTDSYVPVDLVRHPDDVTVRPANQVVPQQEQGVRPARALPYALHANASVDVGLGALAVEFANVGQATAVFHVRSDNPLDAPRDYTVEPHKRLDDTWDVAAIGASGYGVSVHGPNGFLRSFKGGVAQSRARLDVRATYNEASMVVTLNVKNDGNAPASVRVVDRYAGQNVTMQLSPQQAKSNSWSLRATRGWYELVITVDEDTGFEYRFAGHLENGEDSISDPLMGGLV
jgi:phospholipase C